MKVMKRATASAVAITAILVIAACLWVPRVGAAVPGGVQIDHGKTITIDHVMQTPAISAALTGVQYDYGKVCSADQPIAQAKATGGQQRIFDAALTKTVPGSAEQQIAEGTACISPSTCATARGSTGHETVPKIATVDQAVLQHPNVRLRATYF